MTGSVNLNPIALNSARDTGPAREGCYAVGHGCASHFFAGGKLTFD